MGEYTLEDVAPEINITRVNDYHLHEDETCSQH